MVNIHNIMEEQVIARINELYDQVIKKGAVWLTCDCENCRLDTASYVLNRIPPRYVVSGRGATHNKKIITDNQLTADIDKLGLEGMRLVSSSKRPYHMSKRTNETTAAVKQSPTFNFPTITGNVYDGSTFEPLLDATITLKNFGSPVEMMDVSWPNPCNTFAATQGSYTFWPLPVTAKSEKESQIFTFTIEVKAEGYEPIVYTIEVPLVSDSFDRRELNSTYTLKVQDLFLFKVEVENPMEKCIAD